MARNLELKVRCNESDHQRIIGISNAAGASGPITIRQRDTYFMVRSGRLKLRETETDGGKAAEMIQYERPDVDGMRLSNYRLTVIEPGQAQVLIDSLSDALGVLTVVEKVRCLLILGSTRIHLDDVRHLGAFVELETVLDSSEGAPGRGQDEYDRIVALLGLEHMRVVSGSYSDLLSREESPA